MEGLSKQLSLTSETGNASFLQVLCGVCRVVPHPRARTKLQGALPLPLNLYIQVRRVGRSWRNLKPLVWPKPVFLFRDIAGVKPHLKSHKLNFNPLFPLCIPLLLQIAIWNELRSQRQTSKENNSPSCSPLATLLMAAQMFGCCVNLDVDICPQLK